jgi:hypothetical protein
MVTGETMTEETKTRKPRAKNVTPEDLEKMRELEASGHKRYEIGRLLGYSAATITKNLGAKVAER